jgi:hypothetical protein
MAWRWNSYSVSEEVTAARRGNVSPRDCRYLARI